MRRKTAKRSRRSRRRTYRKRGGGLGWSPVADTQQRDIPTRALDVSTPRNSTDIVSRLIEKY